MLTPTQASLDALIQQALHITTDIAQAEPTSPAQVDAGQLTATQVAALIDHTLLKPDATSAQIQQLCAEAIEYSFASVCVNPTWVPLCVEILAGTPVKTCTVIGFPLGATLATVKATEATDVLQLGAQEVDMVLNVGRLRDRDYLLVYADIASVVNVAHAQEAVAKVIIETALLTDEDKVAACVIAQQAGIDFVKTSTGFNGGGATVEDVRLMRRVVGPHTGVKASGGVRTAEDARRMIEAGATRIGTSGGVRIVQDWLARMDASPSQTGAGDNY